MQKTSPTPALLTVMMLVVAIFGCAGTTSVDPAGPEMKMTTDIPASITTPDEVKTRLGTLRFFDGMPDDETVRISYDHLDFMRGVRAFTDALPIACEPTEGEAFGRVVFRDLPADQIDRFSPDLPPGPPSP